MLEELLEMIKLTQEAKVAALENGLPGVYKKQKAIEDILEQTYMIVSTYDGEWE
jgi:hypothetical protein